MKRLNRDEADREAIGRAVGFVLTRYLGLGKYDHLGEFSTLDGARAAKLAAGRDEHGRPAMLYALVPGRDAVHVE
jgi:hypothetical protein